MLAAIEEGPEASVKAYQWVEVNIYNEILDQGSAIGFSWAGTYIHGEGNLLAENRGNGIYFAGHTWSALLGERFAIDYSFYVFLSPLTNEAGVLGLHDAYPSFTVRVNGSPIYYVHESGGPLGVGWLLFPSIFGGFQSGHF